MKRPSAPMAVAFVALLAALTGTAVALPGTNTVNSGDIQNGQVKNRDLANRSVGLAKLRSNSVSSAKVRNDSLTGADVNEGTLGKVPSAAAADTAGSATTANTATSATTANSAATVGGVTFRKLDYRVDASNSAVILGSFGGVTFAGTCVGGTLDVAVSTNGPATLQSASHDTVTTGVENEVYVDENDPAGITPGESLLPDDPLTQVGHTSVIINGSQIQVAWQADGNSLSAGVDCQFSGIATIG